MRRLPPLRQAESPPLGVVYSFPAINTLVTSPSEGSLSQELSQAMGRIEEMIAAYLEEKELMCRNIALRERKLAGNNDNSLPPHHLASFVTQCAQPKCLNRASDGLPDRPLFGSDVRNHYCYSFSTRFNGLVDGNLHGLESRYAFSSRGNEAVLSLLSLLGLEPFVTLPETLDQLSARFLCGNCPPITTTTCESKYVYSWRQSVTHFISADVQTHAESKWSLIPQEAEEDATRREKRVREADVEGGIVAWLCNHCNYTLDNDEDTKNGVVAHIRGL